MSGALWMRFGPVCVVTAAVVHAADSPPSKAYRHRKTLDTACGRRARLYVMPTVDGDRMSIAWPPPVKDAREWGFDRCRDCMAERPGRVQHPPYAAVSP